MAWIVGVLLLVALCLMARLVWKFAAWFIGPSFTPAATRQSEHSFGHLPELGPVGPLGTVRPDADIGSADDPDGLVGG